LYEFRTVKVWNLIPVNLTNSNNVKTFMRSLDDCHFEQFLRGSYKRYSLLKNSWQLANEAQLLL